MIRTKKTMILSVILIFFLLTALSGCGDKKAAETPAEPQKQESVSADQLIAKGMEVDGFSYDYVLTMPDGNKITHKMWVKAGNIRSEMDNPAGGQPILTIINAEEKMLYAYQPEMKQAFKMPIEDSETDTTSPKDYLNEADPGNMIFSSRETFDGKECIVYETKYENGSGKIWIWEEYGVPLRVESQMGNEKMTAEFLNFEIGNIDDSVFQLPEGTQVVDFSTMMPVPQ